MKCPLACGAVILLVGVLGCEVAPPPPAQVAEGPAKEDPAAPKSERAAVNPTPTAPTTPAPPPAGQAAPQPAVEPQPGPPPFVPGVDDPNKVKAEAGVGKKGRGYGGGIYTEPIHVKFLIEQRIVFDVQIPKAMQLYKAEHDRVLRTHQEFMNDIIKANLIDLPELPPGDKYEYNPKTEQLMVFQPNP